jgi:type VI secretion system secreted protein Hcp
MKKTFICIVVMALALFSSVGLAYSAVDIILKIDGIDGESVIDGHEDEIDVLSWNWGVTQTGSMHTGGGGGAGAAQVQDVSIVKYIDKASVNLLRKCFNGEHLTEAVLTVTRSGDNPIDYMVITMSPVLVTSVSTGGQGGMDRLTEVVTLNFAKIKVSYIPQRSDGSPDASIDFTWNIEKNIEE